MLSSGRGSVDGSAVVKTLGLSLLLDLKKKKDFYALSRPRCNQTNKQGSEKLEESIKTRQTLELDFIFRALNQHGADRVKVVIVTTSERTCAGLRHLSDRKAEAQFQIEPIRLLHSSGPVIRSPLNAAPARLHRQSENIPSLTSFPGCSNRLLQ